MSAKRGNPPRGGKSKPQGRGRSQRKAAPPPVFDALPLPAETIRKVSLWLLLAMLMLVALAILFAMRIPQIAGIAIGESIGEAGFKVRRIEQKGINRLNPMQIYRVADDQLEQAMPLVDLDGTRARLLRYGWVKDARVSRRYPDTLVVDIVERTPAAIWQHNRQLALIDRDGVVLEPVKLEAMPDLPLVIGPGANHHATELNQLVEAAPELKPLMGGATWIGGRRWDIRFHSGETLALPEGPGKAARALIRFAEMDRKSQLLGRGFARFDMRVPGKLIVRVSREPGSIVPVIEDSVPVGNAPASQTI